MAFRMRPEVDDWFKNIFKQGPIQTKFDLYYLCLMMGLATGQSEKAASGQDFVDYFVAEYKPVQRLILGLFIMAEIARLGLEVSDREDVRKLINGYLDPTNPAHLKEDGFAKLNDYANAGFNVIVKEQGDNRPHHVEVFVQWYAQALSNKVKGNPYWASFGEGVKG